MNPLIYKLSAAWLIMLGTIAMVSWLIIDWQDAIRFLIAMTVIVISTLAIVVLMIGKDEDWH